MRLDRFYTAHNNVNVQNNVNIQNNVNTENDVNAQNNAGIRNSSDVYGRFSPGDVFHALVVDFTSKELILKLMDGTLFSAVTVLPRDVRPGEVLTFLVRNKDGGKLVLEQQVVSSITNHTGSTAQTKTQGLTVQAKTQGPSLEIDPVIKQFIDTKLAINRELEELFRLVEQACGGNRSGQDTLINSDKDALIYENTYVMESGTVKQIIPVGEDGLFEENTHIEGNAPDRESANGIIEENAPGRESIPDKGNILFTESSLIKENTSVKQNVLIEESTLIKVNHITEENVPVEEITPGKENAFVKEIRKMMESMFVRGGKTLTEKEINIDQVQKDIFYKLDVIIEIIRNAKDPVDSLLKDEINQKISHIRKNISLMSEIKDCIIFQIPLPSGSKRMPGEIYIMQRKRRRKNPYPKNTTVFISLKTENLGKIDSLISISGKRVSIRMSVKKQAVADHIKKHISMLDESLSAKGWKLADMKLTMEEFKEGMPYHKNSLKTVGHSSPFNGSGIGRTIDCRL